MIVVDLYRDRYTLYPFLEVFGSKENVVIPLPERPLYILGIPIIAANPYEGSTEPFHKTTFGMLLRIDSVSP
ncbi:hypothetical protein QPL79_05685 [Ignisphaera sp. 4213-co]|uniref:Uncharacterized protein n=1 Tax=Ignisphaera cupida TaxID=3050454 RepID=A0ABD4Z6N4_9CREN|nr:hypothetical protein [Ignisphaera sp. 4213-co]MDK6028850.1 hypothetical protein [Ignisphaera sp. 4213-co]